MISSRTFGLRYGKTAFSGGIIARGTLFLTANCGASGTVILFPQVKGAAHSHSLHDAYWPGHKDEALPERSDKWRAVCRYALALPRVALFISLSSSLSLQHTLWNQE